MTGLEPKGNTEHDRTTDLLAWVTEKSGSVKITAVRNLGKYIKPGGIFVSVDRLPGSDDEVLWMSGLQNAGFGIDLERSGSFSFRELGDVPALPVLLAIEGREKASIADLLSFCVERRGGLEGFTVEQNDALAELLFSSINPKRIVAGWKVRYEDGSGTANYEVWTSGIFVLRYLWSTRDYKGIKVAAAYRLGSVLKDTQAEVEAFGCSATVSCYDEILLQGGHL
jgi:hypothetical protein